MERTTAQRRVAEMGNDVSGPVVVPMDDGSDRDDHTYLDVERLISLAQSDGKAEETAILRQTVRIQNREPIQLATIS